MGSAVIIPPPPDGSGIVATNIPPAPDGSGSIAQKSAGLDLTNPQGEGTYAMWNGEGHKIPVPYSQVRAAAEQGYRFDTNPNKAGLDPGQQYQRDYNYATTGPGHEEENAAAEKQEPMFMQAFRGAMKGWANMEKPLIDVIGRATGVPQYTIDSSLQAQTPMQAGAKYGTMGALIAPSAIAAPVATAAATAGGAVGVGAGNLAADATDASPENRALLQDAGGLVGGYSGSRLGSAVSNGVSSFFNPKGQWTSAAQADIPWIKLASRVGPTGTGQSALGVKESLAADLKANLSQVPGVLDAKNPLEFSKAAEHFLNETAGPEYRGVADPLADEKMGATTFRSGGPVSTFKVPSTGSPLPANPTIAQTEGALQEVNAMLTKSYNAPANANDPAQIQNLEGIAGQLRFSLNNRIGELSGLPPQTVSALRQRVGALSNIVDNSRERYLANMGGATSPGVAAAGAANVRSMPSVGMKAALLQPLQNYQFRRDLSGAGQVAPQLDPNSPLGQFYALRSRGQGNP